MENEIFRERTRCNTRLNEAEHKIRSRSGWVTGLLLLCIILGLSHACRGGGSEESDRTEQTAVATIAVGDTQVIPPQYNDEVEVANPNPIDGYGYGDTCSTKVGGSASVVAVDMSQNTRDKEEGRHEYRYGDRLLLNYVIAGEVREEDECPSGTMFYHSQPNYFLRWTGEYHEFLRKKEEAMLHTTDLIRTGGARAVDIH